MEPEASAPDHRGLWAVLKEAVRGTDADLTEAPLGRALLLLGVPMVLEMSMESIFALVDVFVASRLGADAVATVGLTETLLLVLYAVAMGLGMGATAVVARRMGEKNPDAAAVAAVQAIGLALLIAVPGVFAGAFWARWLLAAMGSSPGVLATGTTYAQVMLITNVVIVGQFVVSALLRAAGDAATAMRVLWLGNGINIVLSPCLAFGWGPFPALGVTGAAVATVIGRGLAVAYQMVMLARPGRRLHLTAAHLRYDPVALTNMLRLAGNAMLQNIIGMTSWIGLVRIVSIFGSTAVAGYTIAIRLVQFAIMPSWGLSNAATTLVGQNLGAGKPDRAEQVVWRTAFTNMAFLGLVGVVFVAFANPIVRGFSADPEVIAQGISCLRVVSAGFVFYAFGMVMSQAFNGAGDTLTPTLLNFFCFWVLELPLAYLLAVPLGLGAFGGYLAIAVAFSVVAVAGTLLFRRGSWKLRKV